MEIDFYKLQSIANDFVLINCARNDHLAQEQFPQIAHIISKPHTGIGANGVLFVSDLSSAQTSARFFLPDGNETFPSYDAVIALSRYLFDCGVTGVKSFSVSFSGREVPVDVIDSNNFRVSLGTPYNSNDKSELLESPEADYTFPILIDGKQYAFSSVSFDPDYEFLVHITTDWDFRRLYSISRRIDAEYDTERQSRTVFFFLIDRETARVKTWPHKRLQIDFIPACAAAGAAGVMNGLLDREAVLNIHKQKVFFQWAEQKNEVLITASAQYVFSGIYELPGTTGSSMLYS
jgi:diaminopimelate epimerase